MNCHNNEIKYAITYHEETKHSELRLRVSHHYLDFDNKPRAFKVYPDLSSIPLPQDFPIPAGDALPCIRNMRPSEPEQPFDIRTLAELLFFSAGITRVMKYDSGTYYMRAASATGALYPIELYVISKDSVGLPAGVYHFCPGDFSLTKLRGGDFRRKLAAMAGDDHGILASPITVAFTSLAWRNAWKYGARSYRHWFWDSGVIASNLLAVAISAGLRPSLVMGFVDSAVNNLLLLEQGKEAAVALAPISSSPAETFDLPDPNPAQVVDIPRILTLSKGEETEYPEIWNLHNASSIASNEEVMEWLLRAKTNNFKQQPPRNPTSVESKEDDLHHEHTQSLGNVILRRGSSRRFSHSAVSQHQLSTILYSSTRGVPLDFKKDQESLVDIYLIANAVEGTAPGHYFYNQHANSLKQLDTMKEAASRNESGYLCLGQSLFSDASAVIFLMADLDSVLKSLGNRGYRACEFEAGVIAGKIYLSSYAQALGASGSTFYDDAVTEAFSPHAKDKAAMMAVGLGIPAYNARPGKILAARLTKSELLANQ
jgi:SagB-type dehydrogenase family enzyme